MRGDNMNKVLDYLSKTSYFNELLSEFKNNDELRISNTNDSISLFVLLYLFHSLDKNVLVVTPNLYKAQKIYDELTRLLESDKLAFFPQDEFITTEMLAISKEFKVERINTIKKILENEKSLVITNTTGLLKFELSKSKWEKAILNFSKGDILDLDSLPEKLVSFGYTRALTVEEQGEFNFKGSILDIFPINEGKPIRVDFFDNEIDSFRFFDSLTQRSTIQTKSCKIYPVNEFFFTNEDLEEIKHKMDETIKNVDLSPNTLERISEDVYNLENHIDVDKLSRYMTIIDDKPETILDFMDNQIVIYWDYKRVLDNYNGVVVDISDWYENTEDYPKIGFDLIKDINFVYSDKSLYLDMFGDNKPLKNTINVNAKEPMVYNNNIHMAIGDFIKYDGFTTVIIAFNTSKSLNKFIELVDEKFKYRIVGINDEIKEKRINFIVQDNVVPFELFNINTIVLNEDSLFTQKEHKKAKYKSTLKDSKKVKSVDELKKGDYIVHFDHGIGRFLGIETLEIGKTTNDYIYIQYKGDDSLYIPVANIRLIQKFVGSESVKPKLNKLGSGDWEKTKQRVRKKIKDIADKLIKLYAARENAQGFAFSEDTDLQLDFEADFLYNETEDQIKAIEDVKKDMESTIPMDRLLCGDVGFGKTEVALRASFKAVLDNKQVAYLAPTTVLTRQHFYTFKERLHRHGIRVELLNRFITKSNQNRILHDIRDGKVDIVIGTHRILSKDMKFLDLGLLIIDEEQRFGVEHKEIIKELKVNIDVLSLSATPIPRTLQMAIMGVKSMSLLESPPENRYPIQTYVLERNDAIIRDAILRELSRQGQIFYLYNKVEDINIVTTKIKRLVPEAKICFAHGKMSRMDLENVIEAFIDKEFDVLVSTTIIETGIDIPNANTLIIHDADKLGLSQLYQIRGRVGRSDKIAYAYLMYKKNKQLNDEAIKRLKVIKEFTELGSGFKIAIRDLSIRGAGDVLGTEQSGFMDSVGVDLYLEMLKDEIAIQRGEKEVEKVEEKTNVKVNVDKYIDSSYINNDYLKIEMHRKISNIKSKNDITILLEEFKDRFGLPSKQITLYMYEKLFEYLAQKHDIEKIRETKNNVTFIMSKERSSKINGEYIFLKANEISKFIRFTYRLDRLNIIIETIKLDKHYLYYIVDLLSSI